MKKISTFLIPLFSLLLISFFVKANKKPAAHVSAEASQLKDTLPPWALGPFIRSEKNPVLAPANSVFTDGMTNTKIAWESNDVFNPAAVVYKNKIVVLYRAEDKSGTGIGGRTSRIGYAGSTDGITMHRNTKPVMYPQKDAQKEFEWTGGCEDPRVAVTPEGLYVMMYTQWNKKVPRLAVATSRNLKSWTKHGPAFKQAYNGRFFNEATKSASILTKLQNGKVVITKTGGKYFMYWGELHVYAATSTDLINWYPVLDAKNELKILMSPRPNKFDSQLTECGPPALLTENGIVLMYNGKNLPATNPAHSTEYTADSYCAGQALFSNTNPLQFVERLDKPFFIPTADFEKSGQYPAGTVFTEGLVYFKQKWFLYYGCADSRVGVAVCEKKP